MTQDKAKQKEKEIEKFIREPLNPSLARLILANALISRMESVVKKIISDLEEKQKTN